jgi:hypothetical protein
VPDLLPRPARIYLCQPLNLEIDISSTNQIIGLYLFKDYKTLIAYITESHTRFLREFQKVYKMR